jgi:predicted ATP-dependent serine protease
MSEEFSRTGAGDSSTPSVPTRLADAFIGPEREMAVLRAGLDDAIAGRGRLFLVSGEPGIGKSRLAEETSREATARGIVGRQNLLDNCRSSKYPPRV